MLLYQFVDPHCDNYGLDYFFCYFPTLRLTSNSLLQAMIEKMFFLYRIWPSSNFSDYHMNQVILQPGNYLLFSFSLGMSWNWCHLIFVPSFYIYFEPVQKFLDYVQIKTFWTLVKRQNSVIHGDRHLNIVPVSKFLCQTKR